MKHILWFIVLFATSSYCAPELKGDPESLRSFLHPTESEVSITGEAEETAYSDISVVNLVVTTSDDKLSKSMEKNSELRDDIRKYLIGKGIKDNDIKNSKFSSSPEYGWFGKSPSSFKVVNRIAIRISTEQHLRDIAELSDKHSEVVLSKVIFEHSKKDEFNQKVKEAALKKVMEKKTYYEKSLGIKLVPVRFREGGVHFGGTEGADMLEEVIVSGIRVNSASYASKSREPDVARESSFDEVKYKAVLTVDFKIN